MHDKLLGLMLVAIGVFAICGAVLQWRFFMKNYRTRGLVRLIGVQGARIFYIVAGTGLAVDGALIALGIV